MGSALAWGALAASSLVIGAAIAFARRWSPRQVGLVLAFGAGALISAVSFELFEEGVDLSGGLEWVAVGLAAGALTYFCADGYIEKRFSSGAADEEAAGSGTALALGAFLDGIPEQLVLGIGLAAGDGVGVGLIVAIFVSNLPEAMGSAKAMRDSGTTRAGILELWTGVAGLCVLATAAGYAVADSVSAELQAAFNGFAAGALLVMLIDSMIPDARREGGRVAGLVTALGFAVAAGLSALS